MIYFEVAVAVPISQTLTYCLSGDGSHIELSETTIESYQGRRVIVALGKRMVTGYVVAVSTSLEEEPDFTIRPIVKWLDDYPLFHLNLIPFFKWVAKYYQYPLGLVIKAALPGGLAPKSKKMLALGDKELLATVSEEVRPDWLLQLRDGHKIESKKLLAKCTSGDKNLLEKLKTSGCVVETLEIAKDSVSIKTEACVQAQDPEIPLPDFSKEIFSQTKSYRNQLASYLGKMMKISEVKALISTFTVLTNSSENYAPVKEIRKLYSGASKPLQCLVESGLLKKEFHRVYRSPFGEQFKHYPRPENLTREQENVLAEIKPAIKSQFFSPFLLYGVTGCGKTEVYLRSAEVALSHGRDVIILVPEIALATQLEAHLISRFKDQVVLLHSGLTSSEKYDQYFLALSGQAKIVIGARSAIFAPLRDPGLIIVDEEHDTSYKQDDSFRYHARDLAVVRARHHDCVVILGSATPSVTSFENAKKGKYKLLAMKKRVGESQLPTVELVDLSQKNVHNKKESSIIQKHLLAKLRNNLENKKQAVLLLNRRGFSTAILCNACGSPAQCNHCNVSLTLHKSKNRLVCHYCGFTTSADIVCVHCRSTDLTPVGFGTERVEEEISHLIPQARVQRIDSDTAADRKKFLGVLQAMHERQIDILIGTQMIAKGHHFPHVTLVGVVWADGGMSMPDYKAAERTFQLITQVTGRAGRGEYPGEVVIQTLRPDHYALQFAKNHRYEDFFEHEMRLRKHPAFPPYVRLVLLRVQGKVEKRVQQSAMQVARFCRKGIQEKSLGIEVLGPAPSPLDKVRDMFRWQILLKGVSSSELHGLCSVVRMAQSDLVVAQCTVSIDVDPENMM